MSAGERLPRHCCDGGGGGRTPPQASRRRVRGQGEGAGEGAGGVWGGGGALRRDSRCPLSGIGHQRATRRPSVTRAPPRPNGQRRLWPAAAARHRRRPPPASPETVTDQCDCWVCPWGAAALYLDAAAGGLSPRCLPPPSLPPPPPLSPQLEPLCAPLRRQPPTTLSTAAWALPRAWGRRVVGPCGRFAAAAPPALLAAAVLSDQPPWGEGAAQGRPHNQGITWAEWRGGWGGDGASAAPSWPPAVTVDRKTTRHSHAWASAGGGNRH